MDDEGIYRREDMVKYCYNCGDFCEGTWSDQSQYHSEVGAWENSGTEVCEVCGSDDITEAYECERCGELMTPNEEEGGLCAFCQEIVDYGIRRAIEEVRRTRTPSGYMEAKEWIKWRLTELEN